MFEVIHLLQYYVERYLKQYCKNKDFNMDMDDLERAITAPDCAADADLSKSADIPHNAGNQPAGVPIYPGL